MILALTLGLALELASPPGNCAPPREVQAKQGELSDLKDRIETLRREVSQAQASRADVTERLEETEKAISAANLSLRELGEKRSDTERDLIDLKNEAGRLEQDVAALQRQLARLLRQRHAAGGGDGDGMQNFLQGKDPNQIARDSHYLSRLSRAQAELIAGYRSSLDRKRALSQQMAVKSADLTAVEQAQKNTRAQLLAQQEKRRAVLNDISGRIQTRRREIETLKRDEQRLSQLIEGLSRIARKPRPAPRPAARPPTPPATAAPKATPPPVAEIPGKKPDAAPPAAASASIQPAPTEQQPPPPQAERDTESMPQSAAPDQDFARLKGRLRLPTRGELIARFGTPREDGGSSWKGVFIRAEQGREVHSIAAGQVVFADWLRGFGNLVIVDHGGSYLSVYGSNESLLKTAGQDVRAGDAIATVGNSGGSAESGLYFELRHQGRPMDPMKWVASR